MAKKETLLTRDLTAKERTQGRLLAGEVISFAPENSPSQRLSDYDIDLKYIKGETRIVTETGRYPLDSIDNMLKTTDYDLDPEYQRRHRWDNGKKSRLIESFIMNVPVPPIFLYEVDYAKYEVMDGRQRLTAISEFYKNKFQLSDLEYWKELEGRTYDTLPGKIRSGIDRRYLSSIILLKETAKKEGEAKRLKQIVFERLNSGGVRLQPQETRNAIYDGPLNVLCKELAKNNAVFRDLWGIPAPTPEGSTEPEPDGDEDASDAATNRGKLMYEKMDDVELVLRFFAYRQIQNWPGASNRIGPFLDEYLQRGNGFGKEVLTAFRSIFDNTIKLVFDVLETHAFWRWDKKRGTWEKTPNKIIYDPTMYAFSRYAGSQTANELVKQKEAVNSAIQKLHEADDTPFMGRKTNRNDMIRRNELMDEALAAIVSKSQSRKRRP